MTGPNGHAHENGGTTSVPPAAASVAPMVARFSPERVKELVAALEVPFDPSQIEWRVMNTTKVSSRHVAKSFPMRINVPTPIG
jgi:hypothetical protein